MFISPIQAAVLPVPANDRHPIEYHICLALKKYMESHLFYKYFQVSKLSTTTTQCVPNQLGSRVRI